MEKIDSLEDISMSDAGSIAAVGDTGDTQPTEMDLLMNSFKNEHYLELLSYVPHSLSQLIKAVLDPSSSNVQIIAVGMLISGLSSIFIDGARKRLEGTDDEYLRPHISVWLTGIKNYTDRVFNVANEANALHDDMTSRMKLISYARSLKYCFEQVLAWDEAPEQLATATKISATNIVDGESQIVKEWDCIGIQKQTKELSEACLEEAELATQAATAAESDEFLKHAEALITSVTDLCLFARSVSAVTYNDKLREFMNGLINVIHDSLSLVIISGKYASAPPTIKGKKDSYIKQIQNSRKIFVDNIVAMRLLIKVIGQYAISMNIYSLALRNSEKGLQEFKDASMPEDSNDKEIPQTTYYQLGEIVKEFSNLIGLLKDFNVVFSGKGIYGREVHLSKVIVSICNQTVDFSALLTDATIHLTIARAVHTFQSSLEAIISTLFAVERMNARLTGLKKMHTHQIFVDHGKSLSALALNYIQLATSVSSVSMAMNDVCIAISAAVTELQHVIERCGTFLENPTLRISQTETAELENETDFDDDYSIFEQPDSKDNLILMEGVSEEEQGNWAIKGGTLEKLVERVTTERFIDLKFMKAFLTTYRSFTSERELFKLLIRRYNVPKRDDMLESEWKSKVAIPIQLRVCNVLKYWIENYFYDFTESLLRQLQVFIRTSLMRDGYKKFANQLQKAINKKTLPALGLTKDRLSQLSLSFKEGFTVKYLSSTILLDFDLEIVARELTKIDFVFYQSIQPAEFLNQAWNNEKLKHRAPNLLATIARFNKTSNWVSTCIMLCSDLKSRSKMITKFIQLAEHLRRLNNFSSLMAVLSALNSSSVHRMKYAWEIVPQKLLENYEGMGKLMDSHQSFKAYRDEVMNISPPCVPYLGIYLSDLTFIEEGNPDFVGEGLINFHKRKLYYDVLTKIQLYQQDAYSLTDDDRVVSALLSELPFIQHDELFVVSLLHEPRGCRKSEIF